MKTLRMLGLVVLLLLLLTVGVFATLQAWDEAHTLYPTPQTESSFLKTYTPVHVIEQFLSDQSWARLGPSWSGEAGKKFVVHDGGFDGFFIMRPEKRTLLMAALDDDMHQQLVLNGAQILSRSGDFRSGFHYDYKLGTSIGTLTIAPIAIPSHPNVHRQQALPQGTVEMTVHIEEREMWFPKAQLPTPDQIQQLRAIPAGSSSAY
jgi:hypothetical protein